MSRYSKFRVLWFGLKQIVITQLSTNLKDIVSSFVWLLAKINKKVGRNKESLNLLLKSRRISKLAVAEHEIRQIVNNDAIDDSGGYLPSLLDPVDGRLAEYYAPRILILKIPTLESGGVVEKGAIIIKFSETISAIYQLLDINLLSKYFRIILEPSWVGYSLPEILVWTRMSPEKVVVFSPYDDDYSFISSLKMNLIPTTLGPADWAEPSTFKKVADTKKEYDCIYIANFDPVKRVDRYLRAVVRVARKKIDFKAALVCASHGTARTELLNTVNWAKTKANISFFESMQQSELNAILNKSKVNVLVSLREGANKGLSEGLWADVPALLIEECVCGNRRHINEMTGKIVSDDSLEDALLWFSENYAQFDPRSWAESNISPRTSTQKLSELLQKIEKNEGRVWTRDLYVKVNVPELTYLDHSFDDLLCEREQLLNLFSHGADIASIHKFIEKLGERFE